MGGGGLMLLKELYYSISLIAYFGHFDNEQNKITYILGLSGLGSSCVSMGLRSSLSH